MLKPMNSRTGAATAWDQLPPDHQNGATAANDDSSVNTPAPVVTLPVDLPVLLRELEDAYIKAALAQTHSNKKEAAKLLGLGRTTLVEKLRRRNLALARTSQ
jgi:sigma-54 specific flagellar transcriptional regulator A